MGYEDVKRRVTELRNNLEIQKSEKQRFSDLSAKCQKEIGRFKDMMELIYLGNEVSRCIWIWENGSITGYTYELTAQDKDDIEDIERNINQQLEWAAEYSDKSRACKARISEIESELPYAGIEVRVIDMKESIDDSTYTDDDGNHIGDSKTYGTEITRYDLSLLEYNTMNGNHVMTPYTIINYKAAAVGSQWRIVHANGKETRIDDDGKWKYIIRKYLT